MSILWNDLRHGMRGLRRSPGFASIAVFTLALGIGANTALFSVINAVLLHRLPYPNARQLVVVVFSNPKRNLTGGSISVGAYQFQRDHSHVFLDLAGTTIENLNLLGGVRPEQVPVARVTHNFLPTIGVAPVLGRNFVPEEDQPGGRPVAIISQDLWNRRFSGSPDVIGKTFRLAVSVYTVIGVMPTGFDLPARDLEVWITNLNGTTQLTQQQIEQGAGFITSVGRLKQDVSIQEAAAELRLVARQYQHQYPGRVDADPDVRIDVLTLDEQRVQGIRTTLLLLVAAVGTVLLIACANNAALLLARGMKRRRELAIRAALGAERPRLILHVISECLVISTLSCAAGLLLAQWGTTFLNAMVKESLPGSRRVEWDARVLLFAVALSLLSGLLFGLVPSVQISRPDLNSVLREGGRGSEGTMQSHLARSLLVIGQVALSVMLLVGAGLLLRSFLLLQAVNPGFESRHVLTMRVNLPLPEIGGQDGRAEYMQRVLQAIDALPGVESAGAVLSLPLSGYVVAPVIRSTDARKQFAQRPLAMWQSATPDYMKTLRIRLLKGRNFTERDRQGNPYVTIINETMAKQMWPNEDAIGKHLIVARAEFDSEVVGVIGDVKTAALAAPAAAEMYTPFAQRPWPSMNIVVRTAADPLRMRNAIEGRILEMDRESPVTDMKTLDRIVAESFGTRSIALRLVTVFASIALVLALVGLYGVISYSVTQRAKEIGIRSALGAGFGEISGMIVAHGLRLVFAGLALGLVGSFACTRLMEGLLFGIKTTDPPVFLGTAALFAAVAILASAVPAYRAAKVDPLAALRCE